VNFEPLTFPLFLPPFIFPVGEDWEGGNSYQKNQNLSLYLNCFEEVGTLLKYLPD